MREWMREKLMRRRSKRGPNDSESTGKIGQELPPNQMAPLRPAYPDQPEAVKPVPAPPAISPATPAAKAEAGEAMAPAHPAGGQKARPGRGRRRRGGSGRGPGKENVSAPEKAAQVDPQAGLGPLAGDQFDRDSLDAPGDDADFDGPDTDAADPELADADPENLEPSGPGEPSIPSPAGRLVHETQPDSPSVPPPAPQPAGGPKQPRGFVVLTIGLPGSGKTTWFKRRSVTPLSSDMLRGILFDDITEQRYQGLVFSTLRSLLRARLIAKMPWNYVDATNLSPHERRQWIKMATSFGYDVHAVFFDVPFEVCMERNHRRERVVSDEVMHKMNERLRPPSFKEGFSKITVVRVKGVPGSMSAGSAQAAVEDTPPEPRE